MIGQRQLLGSDAPLSATAIRISAASRIISASCLFIVSPPTALTTHLSRDRFDAARRFSSLAAVRLNSDVRPQSRRCGVSVNFHKLRVHPFHVPIASPVVRVLLRVDSVLPLVAKRGRRHLSAAQPVHVGACPPRCLNPSQSAALTRHFYAPCLGGIRTSHVPPHLACPVPTRFPFDWQRSQ